MTNANSLVLLKMSHDMAIVSHTILFSSYLFHDKDLKTKAITLLCMTVLKALSLVQTKSSMLPGNCSDGRRDVQNPSKIRSPDFP